LEGFSFATNRQSPEVLANSWFKYASTQVVPTLKPPLAKPLGPKYLVHMTVALAKDVEEYLQDQVRVRVCSNASELVNDIIRSLRDQQHRPFDVSPELEAWLLEAADKPVTPLTKADFAGIRERVAARIKNSANEPPLIG
jgi:Arc/MetJ-type ribon-helix-helix transcriptional regulator